MHICWTIYIGIFASICVAPSLTAKLQTDQSIDDEKTKAYAEDLAGVVKRGGGRGFGNSPYYPMWADSMWADAKRGGGRGFSNYYNTYYWPYKRGGGREFRDKKGGGRGFDKRGGGRGFDKRGGGRGFDKRGGGRGFDKRGGGRGFDEKRGGGRSFDKRLPPGARGFRIPEYQLIDEQSSLLAKRGGGRGFSSDYAFQMDKRPGGRGFVGGQSPYAYSMYKRPGGRYMPRWALPNNWYY